MEWNGCFWKMDDLPVHTIPSHHPSKMDVLPKTFLKIILAPKWLVWHCSMSPNQHPTFAFSSVFILLLWDSFIPPPPPTNNDLYVPVCGFSFRILLSAYTEDDFEEDYVLLRRLLFAAESNWLSIFHCYVLILFLCTFPVCINIA